ncbi:hypothetical protein AB5N19_09358 [Seiridium cardinale]|uniref:Acyl-CoA dehydrogenase/oxidase C-terminal domain-containing protein n=1 Tax=Seiridium cardinale TaxID=138064 RepID=A0ABR2Y7R4_9PEZI
MEAASATKGFFQELPVLGNQFHEDASIQRILKLFVPQDILRSVTAEIDQLCDEALSPQVLDWVVDAERNQPYISGSGKNAFGQPVSTKLVVTEGWRKLQERGFEKGLSAQGYKPTLAQYTRVIQYMRVLLTEGSSANTSCPQAMQDGASRLLQRQLTTNNKLLSPTERKVFQNAFDHLTSRDPRKAWTSGQWMTERPGGSDVSRTETVASYSPLSASADKASLSDPAEAMPLGPWSISGFKWFSSATDSNMTILLAQTSPGKGVSAFYAPMRRWNPDLLVSAAGQKGGMELNGVQISRLKNKMGTKSLPTAELELNGMRGWLIGEEGKGIREISTILTITRLRSAIGALGYLSRSLAIARAFARVREVGAGKGARVKLSDSPLHMRTLSDMTVSYHGLMLITFYGTYVMGLEEHPSASSSSLLPSKSISGITPKPAQVTPLLRVLTPVIKAYVCKTSIHLVYACMESLGGVGYLENSETEHLNIARLFRDACVLSIWEGTTDVLSTDFVRALKHPREGKESMAALAWLIGATVKGGNKRITEQWETTKKQIEESRQEDLLSSARDILCKVAEILIGALYTVDAAAGGDDRTQSMCKRYLLTQGLAEHGTATKLDAKVELVSNQTMVYGNGETSLDVAAKL